MTCEKCNGTGWYQYSTYGTPHSKPCEDCCKHDQGYWQLLEHYGDKNGKWCCKGCGHTLDKQPSVGDREPEK